MAKSCQNSPNVFRDIDEVCKPEYRWKFILLLLEYAVMSIYAFSAQMRTYTVYEKTESFKL